MTALAAPYLAITSTAGRSSMITRRSRSAAAWRWSARLANLWAWSAPLVLNAAANPLERRSVLPTVMLRRTNTRRARSRSSRPSGVRSKSRGWAGHQPLVLPRQWQAAQRRRDRVVLRWGAVQGGGGQLAAGIGGVAQRPGQLGPAVTQDAEQADQIGVAIVDDLGRRWPLGEQHRRAPCERLHVGAVWWEQAGDPRSQPALGAQVLRRWPHPCTPWPAGVEVRTAGGVELHALAC